MNFDAINKLCSQKVIDLLKEIPDSEATRQYLILTRCILDAFLDKDLSTLKRVYNIRYSTFFLRLWRQWLKTQEYSIEKNFITLNTYTCIELNAHGLILLIDKCRENNSQLLPWLYSS